MVLRAVYSKGPWFITIVLNNRHTSKILMLQPSCKGSLKSTKIYHGPVMQQSSSVVKKWCSVATPSCVVKNRLVWCCVMKDKCCIVVLCIVICCEREVVELCIVLCCEEESMHCETVHCFML